MCWFTLIATFILVTAMNTRRRGLTEKLTNNKGHHCYPFAKVREYNFISISIFEACDMLQIWKWWVGRSVVEVQVKGLLHQGNSPFRMSLFLPPTPTLTSLVTCKCILIWALILHKDTPFTFRFSKKHLTELTSLWTGHSDRMQSKKSLLSIAVAGEEKYTTNTH